MLLLIDDQHKKHLDFIKTIDIEVAKEFCNVSLEFFKSGINRKIYISAAQKLKVDIKCVQESIESLMYVLIETSKLDLQHSDFMNSLNLLGFSVELQEHLFQCYQKIKADISPEKFVLLTGLPFYKDLEWRFDVKIASRSLHHQIDPSLLLKLTTSTTNSKNDPEISEFKLLEMDPSSLLRITHSLQSALDQLNDHQYKRASRNL